MSGSTVRRGAIPMLFGLAVALSACGGDSAVDTTVVVEPLPVADATNPPTNIVDDLVRRTVEATGLGAPIEVLEVREGQLDELMGLTAEAQAAASVDPRASGRRDLQRRAWRVRLIGADTNVVCITDPCVPPRVYVEAFLDRQFLSVIGMTSGEIPAEYASDAP